MLERLSLTLLYFFADPPVYAAYRRSIQNDKHVRATASSRSPADPGLTVERSRHVVVVVVDSFWPGQRLTEAASVHPRLSFAPTAHSSPLPNPRLEPSRPRPTRRSKASRRSNCPSPGGPSTGEDRPFTYFCPPVCLPSFRRAFCALRGGYSEGLALAGDGHPFCPSFFRLKFEPSVSPVSTMQRDVMSVLHSLRLPKERETTTVAMKRWIGCLCSAHEASCCPRASRARSDGERSALRR